MVGDWTAVAGYEVRKNENKKSGILCEARKRANRFLTPHFRLIARGAGVPAARAWLTKI